MSSSPRSRQGFTLIEVLVALAVFSAGILAIMNILGGLEARSARTHQKALLEARAISLMHAILAGAEPSSSGKIEELEGARWTLGRSRTALTEEPPLMTRLELTVEPPAESGLSAIHLFAFQAGQHP